MKVKVSDTDFENSTTVFTFQWVAASGMCRNLLILNLACVIKYLFYFYVHVLLSFNRGIPPWDSANTLYIMREEVQGMLALKYMYIFTFFSTENLK